MYGVSRPSRTTLIGELETIDKKIKATEKELKDLVIARGSTLMGLHGIGPCGAARLLADVGDVRGSPTGIGSRPGTAPHRWTPPPASRSGTGSPAPATDGSTERCTSWPSFSCATPPKAAPTSTATALVLSLSAGVAQADTQPANLGNVANANRGASAEGLHCHFVLPAGRNAAFDGIITGTAHQAHVQTGLPTGVFQATPCP
jgi:hypothetical protein